MTHTRMGSLAALLGSAVLLATAGTAQAGVADARTEPMLQNGGFESGDTAGWSGSGHAVVTSYSGYQAPAGSYFGIVFGGCPTNELAQSFSASAGDTLSGYAFFKNNDSAGWNDSGDVRVVVAGDGSSTVLFSSSGSQTGSYNGTPWTAWSYTFPDSGTYSISIRSSNGGDCHVHSVTGLDIGPVLTPSVTGPTGNDGWRTGDTDVSWAVSGTQGPTTTSGCDPTTVTADTAGDVFTCSVTDSSGVTSKSVTVKRDATAPTNVTFVDGPQQGGLYHASAIPAEPTCTADDATSGLASCVVTGYSTAPGDQSMTATATDIAGNVSTASVSYTVATYSAHFVATAKPSAGTAPPVRFRIMLGNDRVNDPSLLQGTSLDVAEADCGSGDRTGEWTSPKRRNGQSTTLEYHVQGERFRQIVRNFAAPGCYVARVTTVDGAVERLYTLS